MRVTVKHARIPRHSDGGFWWGEAVIIGKPSTLEKWKQTTTHGWIPGVRWFKCIHVGDVSNGGSLKLSIVSWLYLNSGTVEEEAAEVEKKLYSLIFGSDS